VTDTWWTAVPLPLSDDDKRKLVRFLTMPGDDAMNPHDDHAAENAARNDGLLRRVSLPEGWTLFQIPEEPETWDDAAEDREVGRGIHPDDTPTDWEELEQAFPIPRPARYPRLYGGFLAEGS
jgi:hypothetical protein